MLISIINESKRVSDAEVDLMCQGVHMQVAEHFAPAWSFLPNAVQFFGEKEKVPSYAWKLSIRDDSSVADALGYHSMDGASVDGFIFCGPVLDNKGVVLYDAKEPQNVSVSSVLSHEVLEASADRYACFWSDMPEIELTDGYVYSECALEVADMVEGDSYAVAINGHNVSLSNFVFPAWFDAASTDINLSRWDYCSKLTAPFTMSAGGYMVVRQSGNMQQVFERTVPMPQWKRDMKAGKFSRSSKRIGR